MLTKFYSRLFHVLIVFYYTYQCTALLDECPPVEDVYPCYCEVEEENTIMHCNHLNQSSQIIQALNELTDYKIFKVSFYKFSVDWIKTEAFRGPALSQIQFTNSNVIMQSPQFVGQESSLTRLTFLSCFNKESQFMPWSLKHLEKLKDMTFDRNVIPTLKNEWLKSSPPNLRSLTFSECSIQELGNNVFATLANLATLFLNDNAISSISRSMLPNPAENLRLISLSDNNLEELPSDFFESMPSLKTIELQNNKLKTLSEPLWSPIIENLSRVYLESNPINCDKSLKWISKKFLPKTFTGTCSQPERLKDKRLRVLTPADFH